jgi:indole-3-glycerol phosphate synthase
VLTDSKFFQGSFENLTLIRQAGVQCPLLCKEFIVEVRVSVRGVSKL